MSGQPIFIGYEWRQSLQFDAAVVPTGATFRAEVRRGPRLPVIATLTTANGGVTRVGDFEMTLTIPEAATALMTSGHVHVDVVRTDVTPDQHLGFQIRVDVLESITVPA